MTNINHQGNSENNANNDMKPQDHQAILENRAALEGKTRDPICDQCDELAIFALRDNNNNEFSLNLSTILECLKFAENEGIVPPIDEGWWIEITSIVPLSSNQI